MKEPQCTHPPPLDNDDVIGSNQCLCLPKAELNTKNSTKRQLCCRLVEFLVFNSIHWKKSDAFNKDERVEYDVISGWPLRAKKIESWLTKLVHQQVNKEKHSELAHLGKQ